MQRDLTYLLDILQMASEASGFVSGLDRSGFMSDHKSQLAVIRCLEVIGEAAKRVTP